MTGKQLRRIRKELGWTQKRFGEAMAISWNTVARMERGEMGIRAPMAKLIEFIRKSEIKGNDLR